MLSFFIIAFPRIWIYYDVNVYFDFGTLDFSILKKCHVGSYGGTFGFFNFQKVSLCDFCQQKETNLRNFQPFVVEN